MSLLRNVPRNLEEPARIFGMTPVELAACALTYALTSSLLRGLPFSTLLSLGAGVGLAGTILILNRTRPPSHGLFAIMAMARPAVTPVMSNHKELE